MDIGYDTFTLLKIVSCQVQDHVIKTFLFILVVLCHTFLGYPAYLKICS